MSEAIRASGPIDPERYRSVKAHFLHALDLPPEERETYFAREIHDASLRDEVRAMIAESESANTFDVVTRSGRKGPEAAAERSLGVGATVGGYRVLDVIGRGGMGAVYLAEQASPRRKVALKIIAGGRASAESAERFRREAENLGRLEHEGIAAIYEAGTSADGMPFIAMELVDGVPLNEWNAREKRDPIAIARVIEKIARAVAHAHQRGIIHRDLKPANVLVRAGDVPKVLDFGIARRIADDEAIDRFTESGQVMGTLVYMSPEQAAGRSADVDTRSDVYTLGVIAYELLCGRLPCELPRASFTETVAAIRDTAPQPLSALRPGIDPDLAIIVHLALDKEKERRYSSANEFADDIRRFLDHEPIVARPPSRAYLLRKFARRHRVFVAGTFATFLALVGGIVTTKIAERKAESSRVDAERARGESDRARGEAERLRKEAESARSDAETARGVAEHERDAAKAAQAEAEASLDESRAVQHFMNLIIRSASAEALGVDVKVIDAMRHAEDKIPEEFGTKPRIEAAVRLMLGRTRGSLGDFLGAQKDLDRAQELRLQFAAADSPEVLEVRGEIGNLARLRGALEEADRELGAVLAARRATLGSSHSRNLVHDIVGLAHVKQMLGRFAEARTFYEEAAGIQEKDPAGRKNELAITLTSLGICINASGAANSKADATAVFRRALVLFDEADAEDSMDAATAMTGLAQALKCEIPAEHDEGERLFKRAIAIAERQVGKGGATHVRFRMNYAGWLINSPREVLAIAEELRADVAALGPSHRYEAAEVNMLFGTAYWQNDDVPSAVKAMAAAAIDYDATVGPAAIQALRCRLTLAQAWSSEQHFDESFAVIRFAYETAVGALDVNDFLRGDITAEYGMNFIPRDDWENATKYIEEGARVLSISAGDADLRTINVLKHLEFCYEKMGRVEDRKRIRARLEKIGN